MHRLGAFCESVSVAFLGHAQFLFFTTTVLPPKSDSDVIVCLQSDQGLIIDRSLVYEPNRRLGLKHK